MADIINPKWPIYSTSTKIAIIGFSPPRDEWQRDEPFSGTSGFVFSQLLDKAKINKAQCFLAYLFPKTYYLPHEVNVDHPENASLLQTTISQIKSFNPNIIIAVGREAMHYLNPTLSSLEKCRGSLYWSPVADCKMLATFSPEDARKTYSNTYIIVFDLMKARLESTTKELILPQREIDIRPDYQTVLHNLQSIPDGSTIAFDIEGGVKGVQCCSIATSPTKAFIVPFTSGTSHNIGDDIFLPEQTATIWKELAKVLQNPSIGKILQNALYDRFVLAWTYKILIRNVIEDTMLKAWERFSELEKNLGFLCSIYTKEPYYKNTRLEENLEAYWTYCCKDSLVTYEISQELDKYTTDKDSLAHYRFNIELLEPLTYMQLLGFYFDKHKASEMKATLQEEISTLQKEIDEFACGVYYGATTSSKRNPKPKQSMLVNVDSPKQCVAFLQNLGIKLDLSKTSDNTSSSQKSILAAWKRTKHPVLFKILQLRSLLTQLGDLKKLTDPDGKIRCSYNLVGTETGRISCSTSPTGSGGNLQTITKKQRCLYVPSPGYFLMQCDLSGADGWTVAARCADLGDDTMLQDYLFGIKPAKVIALLHTIGPEVNTYSREKLKKACSTVSSDSWLYFACKRIQHGSNYSMREYTMSDQILEDSYKLTGKAIIVEPALCKNLRELYLLRYFGIELWQKQVVQQITQTKKLKLASGQTRIFLDRVNTSTVQRAALATEPQANTTFVCNKALLRLWKNPQNKLPDGSLLVQPVHQVHDAVIAQFPESEVDKALSIIRDAFNFTIQIGKQTIRIPFEGGYGKSWKELEHNFS